MTDELTLERVYRDHFDFVYRIAKHLGGHELAPEDVAQDVFLVVARKLESYQPLSRITTWLYGITLNVVRSRRRRARIERLFRADESEGDDVPAAASPDGAEVVAAWDIADAVLQRLPDKKRDVFIMAEIEGLSCTDIAAIVGAKEETVWSRLHYARKEFDRHLRTLHPELFGDDELSRARRAPPASGRRRSR